MKTKKKVVKKIEQAIKRNVYHFNNPMGSPAIVTVVAKDSEEATELYQKELLRLRTDK